MLVRLMQEGLVPSETFVKRLLFHVLVVGITFNCRVFRLNSPLLLFISTQYTPTAKVA